MPPVDLRSASASRREAARADLRPRLDRHRWPLALRPLHPDGVTLMGVSGRVGMRFKLLGMDDRGVWLNLGAGMDLYGRDSLQLVGSSALLESIRLS